MDLVAMVKLTAIVAVVVLAMATPPTGVTALSCGDVDFKLGPCKIYVQFGGKVPPMCCDALRELVDDKKTIKNRQVACTCLKSLAAKVFKYALRRLSTIPSECSVSFPKIKPSMNCSKVN